MDDMSRIPPPHCTKVFVQRDYSEGTIVRFSTKFLPELEGKIDKSHFEHTVSTINSIYLEAETLNKRTYCESCLACMTAYLTYICMDTYYEKCIKKGSRFIEEQNNTIWVPKGLMLVDPAERGLRILEICILNESTR